MRTRNRDVLMAATLIGAFCLTAGCDDDDVLSTPGLDPTGEWTVTKTTTEDSCDQGVARPGGSGPTTVTSETFTASVRMGPGGVLDIVHITTVFVGDDVIAQPVEQCGTMLVGLLEGDRISFDFSEETVFEGAIGPLGGASECVIAFDLSTEIVFTETSFSGVESTSIDACGSACSTVVTYEAVRCESCAPVEGCPAIGTEPTCVPGRGQYCP